ncbi:MAG: hypothetical protein HKN43_03085 [Rhodothermales bacterium]|nr:hypothetical protein [Rhodothermales bacterium]
MKRLSAILLVLAVGIAGCDSNQDTPVEISELVIGSGKVATVDSMIQVVYTAWVDNADTFQTDQTLEEPTVLSTLLEGWVEGVAGMRVGGRRVLTIPPEKAFGNREVVDDSLNVLVPANSTVVFDIELTMVGPRPVEITDVEVGTGDEAREGSIITVNYTGSLADGTIFDTQGAASFQLVSGTLIEGWIKGIPGMKVGGTRELAIPSELGYSFQETSFSTGVIPAYSTLYFNIELLAVE